MITAAYPFSLPASLKSYHFGVNNLSHHSCNSDHNPFFRSAIVCGQSMVFQQICNIHNRKAVVFLFSEQTWGNPETQSYGTNEFLDSVFSEPADRGSRHNVALSGGERHVKKQRFYCICADFAVSGNSGLMRRRHPVRLGRRHRQFNSSPARCH